MDSARGFLMCILFVIWFLIRIHCFQGRNWLDITSSRNLGFYELRGYGNFQIIYYRKRLFCLSPEPTKWTRKFAQAFLMMDAKFQSHLNSCVRFASKILWASLDHWSFFNFAPPVNLKCICFYPKLIFISARLEPSFHCGNGGTAYEHLYEWSRLKRCRKLKLAVHITFTAT